MAQSIIRPISAALEQRRGVTERARSMQGRVHRVVGFFQSAGPGEGLVDVDFPVWFQEVPALSFGGELGANQVLVDGNFPTLSVLVKSWKLRQQAERNYYAGATLIVVTTGSAEQVLKVHWQVEGKALVNPTISTGSTDDVI